MRGLAPAAPARGAAGPSITRRARLAPRAAAAQATVATAVKTIRVESSGAASVLGSVRKQNEDRYDIKTPGGTAPGSPAAFAGVYDGHGGSAVAEWLQSKLFGQLTERWGSGAAPEAAISATFVEADRQLISHTSGFMGFGERGIGGAKCGATAAAALVYNAPSGGSALLTANVGDARILLVRGNKAVQLTVDHVPDSEEERKRIERTNPNPRMPLVRYVGGTWRVGGLLALSRAFGDSFLKGSLKFEGVNAGGDGYSSGFGLIAEPYTTLTPLTAEDSYLVVASDGLFAEEERGGGGGMDNEGVAAMCASAGASSSCEALAKQMVAAAAAAGSTDDITVVVLRLAQA